MIHLDAPGRWAAPTLLVMLPGAYSPPEEFVEHGMVSALRQTGVAVDVLIAGTELAHYADGSVVQRLHDDVFEPARQRGVQSLWLLGISLGGLVAMACAAALPGRVAGIVALAPYLGRRTLLAEIDRAGGAAAWAAQRSPQPDDLPEHAVWAWLGRGQGAPLLHLGYGLDDRFADGHQRLAGLLPAQRVITTPGGHDWPVWHTLWQQWLARGVLTAPGRAAA